MKSGFLLSSLLHGKYDKTVHGALSFLVAFVGFFFFEPLAVAAAVFAAGVAKEAYDAAKPSDRFDWYDLLADVAGITAAFVVWRMLA